MKKSNIIKRILYVLIPLVIIAIVVIKLKSNKEITDSNVYHFDKEQAIPVQADTIHLEDINAEIEYTGTFEPYRETKISAETQGKINAVLVDVGSVVSKGQTLIILDNSLLKLQLQTIEVQIEGLESDIKRYTILSDADAIQGVQLEKTALGLKSAKVQKATILEQINKTTVRAPFNGIVTAKLSEEGAFAAPGVPLIQITDIRNLRFTVNIPENDLKLFRTNQNYSISADAYTEISLIGKMSMIGSKANMGSSYPIQFSVNNTNDLKIKAGMFGKVNLKNDQQEKGIIILTSAIVGTTQQPQVYLIKAGKAVLQDIVISNKIQNKAIISSGLKDGDIMITSGFINLFENANVTFN